MAEAGYTLIELVVVLLLLSIITVGLGGGIHFGQTVWARSEVTLLRSANLARSQTLLRSLLSASVPEKGKAGLKFSGGPGALRFVVSGVEPIAGGRATPVELTLARGGRPAQIRITGRNGHVRSIALGDLPAGLEFSYLDASDGSAIWLARWRDRARLPDAIRIAEGANNDADSWPFFVARLWGLRPVKCRFDPVSFKCRGG